MWDSGEQVHGAGTDTIRITGVNQLHGAEHAIIPDRIEAGTFMIAAAITRGNVNVIGAIREHMTSLVSKLEEAGVQITDIEDGLNIQVPGEIKAIDVKTMPHPGFPTDMQSQIMALLLTANGTSKVTETVFENRFMHVEEFKRMNADIFINGRSAMITGNSKLQGADVKATDLRAGASLILAGLVSDGYTNVRELKHLDRGYVDFHGKLKALGADVERINDNGKLNDKARV
jgi:UDP-N-acetylglucosamine 1-carboxyvinyltransferase